MQSRRALLAASAALPLAACASRLVEAGRRTIGSVTRLDPRLDAILDASAPIEVLATGHQWVEGPSWVTGGGYLLYSDVPKNQMWRWSEHGGDELFLQPSGLAGTVPAAIREAGSNGLYYAGGDTLLMADSGTRAIARLNLATGAKTILADRYRGKRFNSCNDLVLSRSGAIYFTDPPYGLADGDDSPLKELDFNGVYRLSPDGDVTLIDKLTRPNGIGLSPDERTLYVSVSDEKRPVILTYRLREDGLPEAEPKLLRDFSRELADGGPGLPDGMTVHSDGWLFSSGPGGLYILAPDGAKLGLIATGKPIANCCFGGSDGKMLYMTSSDMLIRMPVHTASA
ncbi:SMP-30/gluconolactonase/LRE family protein [Stakelama marina]|uniref:SMP-30/gluconolactonase/LRE family protein n=1 Tax=Stakelama marina TaxID=2826939 RepID=A0A8T4IDW1_9SPHN|nr:SMP-30/gluconolactonase/LRE family protein [Stakelama marina]MBR0552044.1 SMP-30/gluconolactonase/LRE family protein [Stakelama marina]